MDRLSDNQRDIDNINHLDSTDFNSHRKTLSQLFKKPLFIFLSGIIITLLILTIFSFFNYYPIPFFEKVVDPHMYYIKDFVHSLPPEVQANMAENAAAIGINIYEYNMQMCGYKPDSYWEWWGL